MFIYFEHFYKSIEQLIGLLEEAKSSEGLDQHSLTALNTYLIYLNAQVLSKLDEALVAEHKELTLLEKEEKDLMNFEEFARKCNGEISLILENIRKKKWAAIPEEQRMLVDLWNKGLFDRGQMFTTHQGNSLNMVETVCEIVLKGVKISELESLLKYTPALHGCKAALDMVKCLASECLKQAVKFTGRSVLRENDLKEIITDFERSVAEEIRLLNDGKGRSEGTHISALNVGRDHLQEVLKQLEKKVKS